MTTSLALSWWMVMELCLEHYQETPEKSYTNLQSIYPRNTVNKKKLIKVPFWKNYCKLWELFIFLKSFYEFITLCTLVSILSVVWEVMLQSLTSKATITCYINYFLYSGRGGQSALRFARLRMEKRHNYVRKVAEVAVQLFISNDKPNIAGLVLAGSADFKTELSQSDMFDPVSITL